MGSHYVYNIDPYIHIIKLSQLLFYYMNIWIDIVNIKGFH